MPRNYDWYNIGKETAPTASIGQAIRGVLDTHKKMMMQRGQAEFETGQAKGLARFKETLPSTQAATGAAQALTTKRGVETEQLRTGAGDRPTLFELQKRAEDETKTALGGSAFAGIAGKRGNYYPAIQQRFNDLVEFYYGKGKSPINKEFPVTNLTREKPEIRFGR